MALAASLALTLSISRVAQRIKKVSGLYVSENKINLVQAL